MAVEYQLSAAHPRTASEADRLTHPHLLTRLGLLDGDLPGLVGNGGGGEQVGGAGTMGRVAKMQP
jgi:hypothetical protein